MPTFQKNEWHVIHKDHSGRVLGDFKTAGDINIDVNKNSPSSFTYQLARSDPKVTRDCFAPYRTDAFLMRGTDLVMSGPHTSRKWSSNDEGVISAAAQDWMHLLEKLYMPVALTANNMDVALRKLAYKMWGVKASQTIPENERYGEQLDTIVREMLDMRNAVDPLQWEVVVMPTGGGIATRTFHEMKGLDGKSIYSHIKEISEMHNGFDFDCKYVANNHIQLRLWSPNRDKGVGRQVFSFKQGSEFINFDWEDTGPIATRTFGLGQGHGPVGNLADVSVYEPSDETYRQLEIQEDVGEIADMYQYDDIADDEFKSIKRLTGSLGHKNRGPRHKLDVSWHTSIFPFNWWTNVAPGDRFNFQYDFGFHKVSADYLLLGYTATINAQGDELIVPDLQRISPYIA